MSPIDNSFSFFHNIRRFDQAQAAVNKIGSVLDASKAVPEENRLSFKEFFAISDLAKTALFLDEMSRHGLIQGNKKLEEIYALAKKAEAIVNSAK